MLVIHDIYKGRRKASPYMTAISEANVAANIIVRGYTESV